MATGLSSRRVQLAAVIVIAIGAGVLAAPQVMGLADDDEYVAVVEVPELIDANGAQAVEDELREARHNDSIEAVVLEVDSGGGLPAESERIATAVDRTAQELPVIAAVDSLGASGAYLSMAPADEIYVSPSSQAVGSVGVVSAIGPTPLTPDETTTGPNKQAQDPDETRADQQLLADLFLETVLEYRGDEIELSPDEIARANVYIGTEAVENGFADELGFVDDAIADVADEAGLSSYEVTRTERETAPDPLMLIAESGEEIEGEMSVSFDAATHLAVAPQVLNSVEDVNATFEHSGEPPVEETNGGGDGDE